MNPVRWSAVAENGVLITGYCSPAQVAGPRLAILSCRSRVGLDVARPDEQEPPVVFGFRSRIRRPQRRVAGSARPKNVGGEAPCEGGGEGLCRLGLHLEGATHDEDAGTLDGTLCKLCYMPPAQGRRFSR